MGKVCSKVGTLRVYDTRASNLKALLRGFKKVEVLELYGCELTMLAKSLQTMKSLKSVKVKDDNASCIQLFDIFSKFPVLTEIEICSQETDEAFKRLSVWEQ